MRKKTARILGAFGIAAAAIFLASHEEKKNSVVNNCKGVTMTIEDGTVSEDGLVLDICNESENELTFEEDFILEKWTKGQWYKMPSQSLTHDWEDEPLVVEPHTVAEGAWRIPGSCLMDSTACLKSFRRRTRPNMCLQ